MRERLNAIRRENGMIEQLIGCLLYTSNTGRVYGKMVGFRRSPVTHRKRNIHKTVKVTRILPMDSQQGRQMCIRDSGMVVLESWLHGTPVIVTPNGGLPELITHGRNGSVSYTHLLLHGQPQFGKKR